MDKVSLKNIKNSQIKAACILLAMFAASFVLRYVLNIFISHQFSAAIFGQYSFALRILAIASGIALLGTQDSTFRFFSIYSKYEHADRLHRYLRWNLSFIMKTCLLAMVIGIILTLSETFYDHLYLFDFADYHLAIYLLWIVPFAALRLLFSRYLIALGLGNVSTILSGLLQYALYLALFYIALKVLHLPVNNFVMLIVITSSISITLACQMFFLHKKLGTGFFRCIKTCPAINSAEIDADWPKTSWRLAISSIASILIINSDLVILEIILFKQNAVGYYAAVLVITSMLFIIPGAIYQPLQAAASELLETERGKKEIVARLRIANLMTFILLTAIALIMVKFGASMLNQFSAPYAKIYPTLLIVTLAIYITCWAKPPAFLLVAAGKEKYLLIGNYIELTLLVVLGLLLAYFYGIRGMAMAKLISYSVKTTFLIVCTRKTVGVKPLSIL